MPVGLEKTYERNWTNDSKTTLMKNEKRALAILRWTTFALRPLTVSEMTEALIVEPGDDGVTLQLDELPDSIDDDYINSEIIDICGDLVEVRAEKAGDGAGSRTIHLIHLSVREFLLPHSIVKCNRSIRPRSAIYPKFLITPANMSIVLPSVWNIWIAMLCGNGAQNKGNKHMIQIFSPMPQDSGMPI